MKRPKESVCAGGEAYQLRGEIDGRCQRFRLMPGTNRCGNLPAENELVLAASGVSRRHAVIEVGSGHLILVDLESKNGTFVNGRRVRRAHLRVGDEIGIGEAKLRLERLAAADAALGLELAAPAGPSPASVERETSRLPRDVPGQVGPWLELVDVVVERLLASPPEALTGALRQIARALEVRACCLVERASGDRAGILAAAGEVDDSGIEPALQAFLAVTRERPSPEASSLVREFRTEGVAPVIGTALSCEGRPALGLLVVGEVSARGELVTLLSTLLRLIAHSRLAAAPAQRGARVPSLGLTWPEGYVPGASAATAALHDQVRALAPGRYPC